MFLLQAVDWEWMRLLRKDSKTVSVTVSGTTEHSLLVKYGTCAGSIPISELGPVSVVSCLPDCCSILNCTWHALSMHTNL